MFLQFIDDFVYSNRHWTTCTGIFSIQDINAIERHFLLLLQYDLNFTVADIELCVKQLVAACPKMIVL